MNIKVLNKIESGWIKLNWSDYVNRIPMTDKTLEILLEVIDTFKGNRQAKELVLFKYKHLPAYITIRRDEYLDLLDMIYNLSIERELYENCERVLKIKEKLK